MKNNFIDLHTHGINRYHTKTIHPEEILKIAELHGRAGTSAILPAVYPAPIDVMRKNIEAVKKAMAVQGGLSGIRHQASCILGVHVEGPFLNPIRSGALDKRSFLKPTLSALKKLIDGYEDIIKIITIAPEIPDALKIIERCAEIGIKVNMGHSDATYKHAFEGKKAGAAGITHLFNAMRPLHHREPGLAGLGLLDQDLYIEIIADGAHLHMKTLELIFQCKRLDKIILVSDSVKGSRGKPVYSSKGALAGSGITISDAVRFLKKIGIPEAEAVEAAADNPARYLSL